MDRVLIVEDDPIFLELIKLGLREHKDKFKIVTAETVKEAMEILKAKPISLVITELILPELDGPALIEHMKKRHPNTACIIMAPFGESERKDSLRGDILYWLDKPFEPEELGELIITALDSHLLYETGTFEGDFNKTGGFMKGISVGSFMQMIEMEEKTCLLKVALEDGRKGVLYFKEGELYDAVFEDLIFAIFFNGCFKVTYKTFYPFNSGIQMDIDLIVRPDRFDQLT